MTIYRIYKVNLIGQVNNAAIDYCQKTSNEDFEHKSNTYLDYSDEKDAKKKAEELNRRVEHPDIEYWYRVVEE